MTHDTQLMQQALEALDGLSEPYDVMKAVTALRERLAQPEQEPVAWMNPYGGLVHKRITGHERNNFTIPIYTTPPQRKPLTDEELYKVFPAIASYTEANKTLYRSIARAIEQAHGIKGEAK